MRTERLSVEVYLYFRKSAVRWDERSKTIRS